MTWRDELRTASFRGLAFYTDATDGEHGRRYAEHEYPGRDEPFMEDMGRRARRHTIEGYVLEPGHMAKARALVDACEKPGPGALVHPYLGELQVVCVSVRQRYASRDGGMAVLSFEFVEAGQARFPSATSDFSSSIDIAGAAASTAVQGAFSDVFMAVSKAGYVVDDAIGRVGEWVESAAPGLLAAAGTAVEAAAMARDLAGLATNAWLTVQSPAALAGDVAAILDPGRFDSMPGLGGYLEIAAWATTEVAPVATTVNRALQISNRGAWSGLTRRLALVGAARAAIRVAWPTADEARAARDTLADAIDAEAEICRDDTEYGALMALRAETARGLSSLAPALPRIASYTPARTEPSLVSAHRLYGDDPKQVIARAAEIETRNGLRHPGFAAGGDRLEVLSHAR